MFSAEGLRRISRWLDATGRFLDSLLELGEKVGILLAAGIVAYAVFQLLFSGDDPAQTRSGKALALLNDNWKAALLVILPMFYRSLRYLVRRITRITAAGVSFDISNEGSANQTDEEPASRR